MGHEGSYKEYRAILHNCDPPTIPYLGIYLTDLTFIEDGNQNMDGNLVNFDKRYKVAAVIGEIQQYQRIGYDFAPYPQIQYWLTQLETVDEEEAYNISLRVEPRNSEEAVETLLRDEEKLRAEVKALQLRNADLEQTNKNLQAMLNSATRDLNRLKASQNQRGKRGMIRGKMNPPRKFMEPRVSSAPDPRRNSPADNRPPPSRDGSQANRCITITPKNPQNYWMKSSQSPSPDV